MTVLSNACMKWRLVCQKQVSRARTSVDIPQYLRDVISRPCLATYFWHIRPHIKYIPWIIRMALQWRHDERNGVSIHQRFYCFFNRLFRHWSKKTSKTRVTGLCEGNPPVTGGFPSQRVSHAENVSIWWRHLDLRFFVFCCGHAKVGLSHKLPTWKRETRQKDLVHKSCEKHCNAFFV